MSNSLPNNFFLKGIWQPLNFECDINDPIVIGKIPQELNGTFYRNGPNPQYIYSENYHMFEGDGMLHAMNFKNGEVHYQNRWIRTDKFLAERIARKSLFGGMRDFMQRDESVKNHLGIKANTNIIWHHNKLLALNEGDIPISLENSDLTQCNIYTFNKILDRSMMAHPKIDPTTNELIFYSYFGPDFRYYIANQNGEIIYQQTIALPFQCMMHDFAITKNFTILPLFPLIWDFQRFMRKEPMFKWEPNLNTRFAIMPRYGKDEDIVWFEDEATLGFHVINAYEEANKIILEMVAMDNIPHDAIAFADDSISYTNYFTRWTFDLQNKTITKEILDNINVEFPRIDERSTGHSHRHTYMNGTINKTLPSNRFDSIIHYDVKNNTKAVHHFGDNAFPLEPIFVPRSPTAEEGDGFLLSYVYREKLDRSDLVILDAQHVDAKPLAIIQLPHRVPFGFHGCWVRHN